MRVHRTHAAAQFVLATATTALFILGLPSLAHGNTGDGGPKPKRSIAENDTAQLVPGISRERMIAPASLYAALAAAHRRIPSFSRQTKLACSVCHYQFPQLTPFGRLFKLNGYTLTGLETIGQPSDSGSETLKLAPIPPASAMLVTSLTRTAKAQPETQNNTASFPQQLSLFLAGQ